MSTIDCAAFDRRLDAGEPADVTMRAHAATCARCAAALAAMAEIDAWFAAAPAAPEGFTAAVMARVTPGRATAPAIDPALEPNLAPWWLDILLQPAVVLAAILVALVVWRARAIFGAVEVAATWLAGSATHLSLANIALTSPMAQWAVLATTLGVAPILAYAMYALSGWIVEWTTPRAQ